MGYNLLEATLAGVAFSSLSENEDELVLVDIIEEEAKMDTQTIPLVMKDGLMRTVNRRKSLSVKLVFCIRTQDVARRAELRDAVAAWAMKGGALKTNTRPGKQLSVKCDEPAALQSSAKWTDELTLTLTAYAVPYWQDAEVTLYGGETTLLHSGENWLADVYSIGGQLDALVAATIINKGAAPLTHIKLQCGSTMMELDGINIQPNMPLLISYDNDNLLFIEDFFKLDGSDKSLFAYRTADSSDDLIAAPDVDNQIIVSADSAVSVSLTTRGLWL